MLWWCALHALGAAVDGTCEAGSPEGGGACSAPAAALLRRHGGACSVDVVSAAELTHGVFARRYHLRRPLIVSGAEALPRGAAVWSVDALAARHGQALVAVGSSRSVMGTLALQAEFGGGGAGWGEGRRARLADLVELLRAETGGGEVGGDDTDGGDGGGGGGDNGGGGGDRDALAFDGGTDVGDLFESAPELLHAVRRTAAHHFGATMGGTADDADVEGGGGSSSGGGGGGGDGGGGGGGGGWDWRLLLGGRGSGVPWHHQADGWAFVFEGSQRWYFSASLPPGSHGGRLPAREWQRALGALAPHERPLECATRPGDLVYVPEGWWQATVNTGAPATLAVAAHRSQPLLPAQALLEAAARAARANQEAAAQLLLRVTADAGAAAQHAFAWSELGKIHARRREHHMAEELSAKNLANALCAGRNCDVLHALARALLNSLHAEPAELLLRNATRLCESDGFIFATLADALEQQGRREEASAARQRSKALLAQWNAPRTLQIGDAAVSL